MKYRDRPAAAYETGRTTRALRVGSAVVSGLIIAAALVSYPSLPATVATHLDASGTPDAWGPRSSSLALLALWGVSQALLTWLSCHPRIFNYPTALTDSNAQRLYREGERMMVWVCVGVTAVFAGIVATIYGIEAGIVAVVLGLIALPVATIAGMIRISLAEGR